MADSVQKRVFIDEYGTPDLAVDKSGVTTHYIVAAVLVAPDSREDVEAGVLEISSKYFSESEIKSSSVGKDDTRRLRVLKDIAELPFHLHVLSVDKRSIFKSGGLVYKRPFIKYMHGRLYRFLFAAHPRIALVIDQHGSKEFMRGFVKYIEIAHVQPDLFSIHSTRFADSEEEIILQIADFCAGSFARVFDPKKMSTAATEVLSVLRPKVLMAEHWPPRMRGFSISVNETDGADAKVRSLSHRSALTYLENNYNTSDPDLNLRVEVLRYLLFRLDHDAPGSYVPTNEILRSIREVAGMEVSDTVLRAKAIGPLRDDGVMIVSGGQGYKIADCTLDVRSFVSEVDRRVVPQLKRLGIMRDGVLSTTSGEVDILNGGLEYLARAIESVREPI